MLVVHLIQYVYVSECYNMKITIKTKLNKNSEIEDLLTLLMILTTYE
jgi:hypothetical protein